MCPLWPANYFFMCMVMFGIIWITSLQLVGAATTATAYYDIKFESDTRVEVLMDEISTVKVILNKVGDGEARAVGVGYTADSYNIINVNPEFDWNVWQEINATGVENQTEFISQVKVTGEFIGHAELCAATTINGGPLIKKCTSVAVRRESRAIDKAFTYSVIVLVAIIYVNIGAALDVDVVKKTIKRPIGPAIGFVSQFAIMPLLSYGIAKALIPNESMQLGLFVTGCSPAGGASNIWTLLLGGNLDLSITMTTISTFSAFVMMPIWILYFGRHISDEAHLKIPHSRIATFCAALIVPLLIGILIKKKLPKVATILVRILKPFAAFLIIFIIVFAIYTNSYLFQFQLFNSKVILSGMLLPWLGYIIGTLGAMVLRQNWKDSLAIGIETGVQNTGLAIFVLRLSLDPPDNDLTTVMPVAVAIMTPVLPLGLLIGQKFANKICPSSSKSKEEVRSDGMEDSKCNQTSFDKVYACNLPSQSNSPS